MNCPKARGSKKLFFAICVVVLMAGTAILVLQYRAKRITDFLNSDRTMGLSGELWEPISRPTSVGPEDVQGIAVTNVSHDDLVTISRLENLRQLSISSARTSDFGPLAKLNELRVFGVSGALPRDFGFLSRKPNLWQLEIKGRGDDRLEPIPHVDILEFLYIYDVQCDPPSNWAFLKELTTVETLSLVRTNLPDLTLVQHMSKLENLNIDGTTIVDLSPLLHCASLKRLYVTDTDDFDAAHLAMIKASLPQMTIYSKADMSDG